MTQEIEVGRRVDPGRGPADRAGARPGATLDRDGSRPAAAVDRDDGRPGTATGRAVPPTADEAVAAALAGDLGRARHLADGVLRTHPDPRERARAAEVLAAALAHRGPLARCVDLHRWIAGRRIPFAWTATAAVPLLGVGALQDARHAAGSAPAADACDLGATADTFTARGVCASVDGDAATAQSLLATAAAAQQACDRPVVRGDTPAALGALVALHRGEPELAGPLLDRAVAGELGGPAAQPRHLLLRAWGALVRDDEHAARAGLARADVASATHEPAPRDELLAVGLEVGLARRAGDEQRLRDLWPRAGAALARHPLDLYALLPLDELSDAAARLDDRRVAGHLARRTVLLDALGRPPLWSARPAGRGGL